MRLPDSLQGIDSRRILFPDLHDLESNRDRVKEDGTGRWMIAQSHLAKATLSNNLQEVERFDRQRFVLGDKDHGNEKAGCAWVIMIELGPTEFGL